MRTPAQRKLKMLEMGRIRLAVALLFVLAGHALAAGEPPMLNEVIKGLGAGLKKATARVMSSSGYYPAEKCSIKFHTTQIGNCAGFGCWEDFALCGGGCTYCRNDAYAESQLSCHQEHGYYGYGHQQGINFPGDANNVFNHAGSCSWEIRRFATWWPIYEADGRTIKAGTVRGMCTLSDNAEHCQEDKDGPLCGGLIITIDAYWYYTQDAWWKSNEDVRIANDGYWDGDDSCCLLDWDLDLIDANQCDKRRREGEQRSNNTAGTNSPRKQRRQHPTPGAPAGAPAGAPTAAAASVSTANYDHDYTGTYYIGDASVFWGTFYATNQATGEKWEEDGTFQWVVDTWNWGGAQTGSPPADRYELEPNSVRFDFSKESKAYSYMESSKEYRKFDDTMQN